MEVGGYNRGDLVLATLVGGDKVERRVWNVRQDDRFGTVVMICTSEMYLKALAASVEPDTLGFRVQFIEPVDES